MSAKVQAKHKVSRRLGINLWGSPKSPFNVRPTKPGQHGKSKSRSKVSIYASHLKEKQKIRFYYDIREEQLKRFFKNAYKTNNIIGKFLGDLERRLDTLVYRAKWAPTIYAAKQIVKHKQIKVNEKVVDICSYLVKQGDVISLVDRMKNHAIILSSLERADKETPAYYDVSSDQQSFTFLKVPVLEEIPYPFSLNPSLIVEFYSRRM